MQPTGTDIQATSAPLDREALYERYEGIFAGISRPFAFVDLDALEHNARHMLAQAGTLPIRVASKSVRSRAVLERIFALDERFRGILSFTLEEALMLAEHGYRDVFVGYPTADREALSRLAALAAERPDDHPVLLVDEVAQLDLIEAAAGRGATPIRVAIDIDPSWRPLGTHGVRIGPKRSPVRTPEQARALAREAAQRPGTRLVGAMAYEGQIAGVGDRPPGRPLRGAAIRVMQRRSLEELRQRLPGVIAAVREEAEGELEFVNCGGTGSLARSASLGVATELSAGSGFYAPALFDAYSALDLRPAAFFCLPIVRRPGAGIATALGGGYIASGPAGADRLPQPYLPAGLRFDSEEGAGEVQTPLLGAAAGRLRVGDRVYLRHAKAGELCERFNSLYLVQGERIVDEVPTYRGEGWAFL